MKVILDREYWPTSTHGTITINDKVICHTLESPVIPGCPKESCLPEGSYILVKEDQMPFLTLQKTNRGPFLGVICPQGQFRVDLPQTILPIHSIKSEGQGTNPQKAFSRLIQALGKAKSAQETFRLEIRSCPDKALNLACCEKNRMDGLMVQAVGGGVIALLLSTIAFFLKLLIQDVRQMGKELGKLKEVTIRLQSEQALIKTLLQNPSSGTKSKKIRTCA